MASQRLNISKEDKDEFIREKMEKMKKKSEEILRRHAEVEADKRNADALSMQITKKQASQPPAVIVEKKVSNTAGKTRRSHQPIVIDENAHLKEIEEKKKLQRLTKENGPPPDPVNFLSDPYRDGTNVVTNQPVARTNRRHYTNYGGQDFQNVKHLMKEQRKYERQYPQTTNNNIMLQMTGKERKEYENWKAERLKIDEERIARQLTSSGSWKREWDLNKIEEDRDVQKTENVYYKQPRWLTEAGNKEGTKGNQSSFNPIVVDSNTEVETKNKDRSVVINENNSLTIVRSSETKDTSFVSKGHKDVQRNQDEKLQFERKSNFVDNEEKYYFKHDINWKQDNMKKQNFKITVKGDGWDTFQNSRNKNDRNWKQNESAFNKDFNNTTEEWQRNVNQKNSGNWESSDKRKQSDNWNSNSQERFHGRNFKFKNNQEKFEETQNYFTEGTKGDFREGEKLWNKTRKNSDGWTEEGWTKSKDTKARNENSWNKSKENWTRKSSGGWEEYNTSSTENKNKYFEKSPDQRKSFDGWETYNNSSREYKNKYPEKSSDGWEDYNSNTSNEYKKYSEKSQSENFRGSKKVYNSSTKSKFNESGWDGEEERFENSNQKKSPTGWENNMHKREKSEGFDEKRGGDRNWDFKKRGDRRFTNSNGKWFRENQNNRNNQRKNFSFLQNKDFHKKKFVCDENVSEILDNWNIDPSKPIINNSWELCNTAQSFAVNTDEKNKIESTNNGWESCPVNNQNKCLLNVQDSWNSNSKCDDNVQNKAMPPEGENHEDSWEDVTTSGGESLELSGPNDEITPKVKDDISIESDIEQQLNKYSFALSAGLKNSDNQLQKNIYAEEHMNEKDIVYESKVYERQESSNFENFNERGTPENSVVSHTHSGNDNEQIHQTNTESICNSLKDCDNDLSESHVKNESENLFLLASHSEKIGENPQESLTCSSNNLAGLTVINSDNDNHSSADLTTLVEMYVDCEAAALKYLQNKISDSVDQTEIKQQKCTAHSADECEKENELNNVSEFEISGTYDTIVDSEKSALSLEREIDEQSTAEIECKSLITKEHNENLVETHEKEEERISEFVDDAKESIASKESCENLDESLQNKEHEIINDFEKYINSKQECNEIIEELNMIIEFEIENKENANSKEDLDVKEKKYETDNKSKNGNKDESEESVDIISNTVHKPFEQFVEESKEDSTTSENDFKQLETSDEVIQFENEPNKENTEFKENCLKTCETEHDVDKLEDDKEESKNDCDEISEEKHEANMEFESKETSMIIKEEHVTISEENEQDCIKEFENENENKSEDCKENISDKAFEEKEIGKGKHDLFVEDYKEINNVEHSSEIKNETIDSQTSDNNSAVLDISDVEQKSKEVGNVKDSILGTNNQSLVVDNENKTAIELNTNNTQPIIENSILQEYITMDMQKVHSSEDFDQEKQKVDDDDEDLTDQPMQRTVRKALATESVTEFTEVLEVTASVPLRTAMQEVEKSPNNSAGDDKTNSSCEDNVNTAE